MKQKVKAEAKSLKHILHFYLTFSNHSEMLIFVAMKPETTEKIRLWAKRLGFWGFLFFLIKGLLWLAAGYFVFR